MGGDWHKEDSQLRLLPPRPPPVSFISHVPSLFMLLDGFCLPGHALSISCASPRRKVIVAAPLLALLITFSLFPTHEYFFFLHSPASLGWDAPSFAFFYRTAHGDAILGL